jgi:DNA-binding transcriptional LysR family regulator
MTIENGSAHPGLETLETVDAHKLHMFFMITQCGSIGDAARRMHLTRSALSHAIRSLERDLGCELFVRHDRSISLTACGRKLVPMAESILKKMVQLRERMSAN